MKCQSLVFSEKEERHLKMSFPEFLSSMLSRLTDSLEADVKKKSVCVCARARERARTCVCVFFCCCCCCCCPTLSTLLFDLFSGTRLKQKRK